MYKLYTDMGLVYPPQINLKKEEEGGYLNSLTVENITKGMFYSLMTSGNRRWLSNKGNGDGGTEGRGEGGGE